MNDIFELRLKQLNRSQVYGVATASAYVHDTLVTARAIAASVLDSDDAAVILPIFKVLMREIDRRAEE